MKVMVIAASHITLVVTAKLMKRCMTLIWRKIGNQVSRQTARQADRHDKSVCFDMGFQLRYPERSLLFC